MIRLFRGGRRRQPLLFVAFVLVAGVCAGLALAIGWIRGRPQPVHMIAISLPTTRIGG